MNKNNRIVIKIILFLTILFLIFLIYYLRKKKIESFFNAGKYILTDCADNWAKNFNKGIKDCNKSAWVTDPNYLCGVCDKNVNKNISMLKTKNKTYFGCDNENATNSYGLQWKKNRKLGTYTKLRDFVTDLLTCNTFNVGVTSGMYIFLCCDDYASFTINGQTTTKNEGWEFMGMYYIENIKYDDVVNLSFQNTGGVGGFNVSYIWNKQLFIMDKNGYENVANIINYTVTGNSLWSTYWQTLIVNDILPPWMYNWISLSGEYGTMSFKVGDTKNKGLLNGDLQGWIGIDDTVKVYINDRLKYSQANVSSWEGTYNAIGWTGNFTVPNVKENSIMKIVGYNGGGPAGLGLTYLWNGLIFCLPSTLANFNNCAFQMNYKTQNEQGGMSYVNGNMKNFPWETNWLNFSSNVGNFQLNTKVSPTVNYNSWVYPPTKNLYYTMSQSNLVGNWSVTNIKNSATMSISFWIIISQTNSNWRTIFQVSNLNVGNRVPAMFICPGNTQFYIRHSTSSNGDDGPGCSSYQVPLNTATFITVIFNSTTMTFYANGVVQQTYTFPSQLVSANSDASFYMADPGSYFGGFQIKNFTFYNNVFNSDEVMNLYEKEMTIPENTVVVATSSNWVYPPTENTYYTMPQTTLVGNWSVTNINNSATMSISFWIIVSEINSSNWRSIFHVSNQNVDCCNVGNRLPAMWICPGNTNVYIRHSTSSNGDDGPGCSSYQIPLNTATFITVIFNSTTMTFYANAVVQQTYTFSSPLLAANSDASFYMADPWYGFGGFQIKNFTLYNNVLSPGDVSNLYQTEMSMSPSTEVSSIPSNWVYAPTENTYYTMTQSNLIGNWSITNISNSATMSISFWIIVSETNPNWRSIFHVSNQNVDCCDSGNRIPAMWIAPNNTGLAIAHSSSTNGNMYPPDVQYELPLNTDVFLTIVFNGTSMILYANAISQQTYTYPSPLISANSDASFYMADPWYAFGGFQIKNFTMYNNVLSSGDVYNLYQSEMNTSKNTTSMIFAGNCPCRFNGWQANSMGYLTQDSCNNLCLEDNNCVAADMARPNSSNQYDCYNFFETIPGGASTLDPCDTTDTTVSRFKKEN